MPPSKPAHIIAKKSKKPELTMEQRWALADAKEAFKQAKKAKPSSAQDKVDKAVAKYEHLAQQQLAKQQATAATKEEPAITTTNQDEIPTDVDEDN